MTNAARAWLLCGVLCWLGCGDDDGVEADRLGVGAQCDRDDDCLQPVRDAGPAQSCLTQFKGGYCGVQGCAAAADCPQGSACVMHDDGQRYCFRTCADKAECNVNRAADVEANCSSTVRYVSGQDLGKACVPPSGK